jgi:hypothetical protein
MNNPHHLFHLGRMASVMTTALCLFGSIPQQGLYAALSISEIATGIAKLGRTMTVYECPYVSVVHYLIHREQQKSCEEQLAKSFENLAQSMNGASDSYKTAKLFFQNFLDLMNEQNTTAVTIKEACHSIRKNMDSLSIPLEYREHLLLGLDLMNKERSIAYDNDDGGIWSYFGPIQFWNWLGANNKDKKNNEQKIFSHAFKFGKWEVIAFSLFCLSVVLVAFYAPATLSTVVQALINGAQIFL